MIDEAPRIRRQSVQRPSAAQVDALLDEAAYNSSLG